MFIYIDKTTNEVLGASEKDVLVFNNASVYETSQNVPTLVTHYIYNPTTGKFILNKTKALLEKKTLKLQEIITNFEQSLGQLANSYPQLERESWPQQEKEARAYLADPTASTPLLDALSAARGITKDTLAQKIVVKADQYTQAAGALIGKRQALEDAIDAATTITEVEAIKW